MPRSSLLLPVRSLFQKMYGKSAVHCPGIYIDESQFLCNQFCDRAFSGTCRSVNAIIYPILYPPCFTHIFCSCPDLMVPFPAFADILILSFSHLPSDHFLFTPSLDCCAISIIQKLPDITSCRICSRPCDLQIESTGQCIQIQHFPCKIQSLYHL